MSRELRCARCGMILYPTPKAVPQLGKVIDIVAPHECGEPVDFTVPTPEDMRTKQMAIAAAEGLPFGKKLTEIREAHARAFSDALNTGDQRQGREELVKSSAPRGILDALKTSEEMEG